MKQNAGEKSELTTIISFLYNTLRTKKSGIQVSSFRN